ncbi:efflux RND transporter periplasmic adaptor subunit [Patescibacteria group bacterium]|nr:efflux RND transporter periplasmic adaptor subunit [Patescibacteria group bacterium]
MKEKTINIFKGLLKRKKLLIVIIIVVVGGLIWRFQVSNRDDLESFTIERGTVQEELILSGSIDADEYASLSFPVSGKISWIAVTEGEWVKKGQALAKIDTTSLNATYQRAQSDLRSADASVEKAHDDVKDHDGDETYTQKEIRTVAEVAKDKAWEAVIIAQENLNNATLYAPFEGVVTFVANPYSGVNVIYTATQFELLNPETIYFYVTADQSEVNSLSEGQKVVVILDSFSDEELEGEITFISRTPMSGESGAVYKVKIGFATGDLDTDKLRIGMTGDAKFVLEEKSDVLNVPPDFINSDTKGRYVQFGKKNNKVYVEVGLEGEESVEISGEGIKEGDTVYD